nr:hypothetical protein [Acinetobacter seifertii]
MIENLVETLKLEFFFTKSKLVLSNEENIANLLFLAFTFPLAISEATIQTPKRAFQIILKKTFMTTPKKYK